MKIHELPGDPGRRQKRKRVGRGEGSGLGKTSGKGHKGAQARAGYRTRPYFEGGQIPLIRRLPKFGFTNIHRVEYQVVNVAQLNERFDEGATIKLKDLRDAGLTKGRKPVKVLGNGDLSKKLTVHAHAFSASALEKISGAGGTTDLVPMKPGPSAAEADAKS